MTISVTELKARCLEIIREVQRDGKVVEIVRRGEVVARLLPASPPGSSERRPWETLRGSGQLIGSVGESVLEEKDFEALR